MAAPPYLGYPQPPGQAGRAHACAVFTHCCDVATCSSSHPRLGIVGVPAVFYNGAVQPGRLGNLKAIMIHRRTIQVAAVASLATLALAGCGTNESVKPEKNPPAPLHIGKLLGGSESTSTNNAPMIGVNSFLWRASLDTVNFMPLASADPFGGVVITDWYATPESPSERFKVTIYVLDTRLRADAIKVAVFRQVRATTGEWTDAPVNPAMATDLENTILTRARQLRIATAG